MSGRRFPLAGVTGEGNASSNQEEKSWTHQRKSGEKNWPPSAWRKGTCFVSGCDLGLAKDPVKVKKKQDRPHSWSTVAEQLQITICVGWDSNILPKKPLHFLLARFTKQNEEPISIDPQSPFFSFSLELSEWRAHFSFGNIHPRLPRKLVTSFRHR